MVLETEAGQLVAVEVNNNAAYGYDVRGELVGEKGSVHLAAPVHARRNGGLMASERYAPDWRPRFAEAYRLQDKAFVAFVRTGALHPDAADAWDGYRAAVVAEAGVEAPASATGFHRLGGQAGALRPVGPFHARYGCVPAMAFPREVAEAAPEQGRRRPSRECKRLGGRPQHLRAGNPGKIRSRRSRRRPATPDPRIGRRAIPRFRPPAPP